MVPLGERMKDYENDCDYTLEDRLPVVVRIDGKRFSRYTKQTRVSKPFDESLSDAMCETMMAIVERTEGCVFGYTQSDEISLVLRNDQSERSEPWFGNRIQKITSVVSSTATAHFNQLFPPAKEKPAYFDARVFTVPTTAEVINYLIWRQNDAIKNSVSAACYYEIAKKTGRKTSRKMMHGHNQEQQKLLLADETGINWEDYAPRFKYGSATYKKQFVLHTENGTVDRSRWALDHDLPIFSNNKHFLSIKVQKGE